MNSYLVKTIIKKRNDRRTRIESGWNDVEIAGHLELSRSTNNPDSLVCRIYSLGPKNVAGISSG